MTSGVVQLFLFVLGLAMAGCGGYCAAKERRKLKSEEPRIAGVERRKKPR